ncbi:MAG TPA: hypothetical protein VFK02_01980 [Kofleriaceae bacterium]|nr:hypothetical protein [Kofleriaceae bacterium]
MPAHPELVKQIAGAATRDHGFAISRLGLAWDLAAKLREHVLAHSSGQM